VDGAGRLYAGGLFTTAGGGARAGSRAGRRRVVAARSGTGDGVRALAGPRASQLFAAAGSRTAGRQAVEQVRHLHMPVSLGVNPPSDAAHGLEVAVPGHARERRRAAADRDPGAGRARLAIYDVNGRLVARTAGSRLPGRHERGDLVAGREAGPARGRPLYFARLTSRRSVTRRLVVLE